MKRHAVYAGTFKAPLLAPHGEPSIRFRGDGSQNLLQSSTLIPSTLLARLMALPIDRTLPHRDILCTLQDFLKEWESSIRPPSLR